jgi:hypothetical protein
MYSLSLWLQYNMWWSNAYRKSYKNPMPSIVEISLWNPWSQTQFNRSDNLRC